jgi:hypothetical protein
MVTTYSGMTYEQASRETQRVLERYGWYQGWERLSQLRAIMERGRAVPPHGSGPGGPSWQPPKGERIHQC